MRKKVIVVSYLPHRLPSHPAKRILLSRETIRTLSSEELSQAAGGGMCQTGSTRDDIGIDI
jgi:hypothetical protein